MLLTARVKVRGRAFPRHLVQVFVGGFVLWEKVWELSNVVATVQVYEDTQV
jgi:hypothetical protein